MDALRAALSNGADAVYLGASLFGARASVGFDESALTDAVSLAHLHKRRVHVTVNTLMKDDELPALRRTLSFLSRLGADAVLVQDVGALKICLSEFPSLPVHASTQMTITNACGAELLKGMGVRRVVLARECNLDTIRRVAATGIETEVFAHGALCVSVSGQCLFSSMIGGRSGNRGRCAQPCRLPYAYDGKTGAWLSPRDLCVRDNLPELINTGMCSLKIEGRLKRPEYVAVVTRAYRSAIDAALEGRFSPADDKENQSLRQIFCRGGFTSGRAFDKEDAAVIDPTRVKPIGILLGQITRIREHQAVCLSDVRLAHALHDGDGLEIGEQTALYSGPSVPAGQTAIIRLRTRPRVGDAVRRTDDEAQLKAARATYEGDAFNAALSIPLSARLTAYPNRPLALTLTDCDLSVTCAGDICQPSQSKPLDADAAARSLRKTGGTPYVIGDIALDSSGAFAPASALNSLRRNALDLMTSARIAASMPRPASPYSFMQRQPDQSKPALYALTDALDEAKALRGAGADHVILSPRDLRLNALEKAEEKIRTFDYFCLPTFCDDDTLNALVAFTKRLKMKLCLQNVGQLAFADGVESILGGDIPLMNGEAAAFCASLGARAATLSREMSGDEIAAMPPSPFPLILPVYGRTRLMLLKSCPYRVKEGLSEGHAACERCFQGGKEPPHSLSDRYGNALPLIPQKMPGGCMNALYSHRVTDLIGQALPEGISYLAAFTDETPDRRISIVHALRGRLDGDAPPSGGERFLGRYIEGVQ